MGQFLVSPGYKSIGKIIINEFFVSFVVNRKMGEYATIFYVVYGCAVLNFNISNQNIGLILAPVILIMTNF